MGQLITIACPSTWRLASFAKLLESITHDESCEFSKFDDQLQAMSKDSRWKLIVNEISDASAAADEYASNEVLDARFRREVESLRFFTIRFDDVDVTRRVLRAIAQEAVSRGETVWIDTDYGWVLDASELLTRTDRDARWDWRRPSGDS